MEIGNESFTKPKETVQEKSKLTNDQAGSKQTKKQSANENSNRKEKKSSEKTRNQKDALGWIFCTISENSIIAEIAQIEAILWKDSFSKKNNKEYECEFEVAKQLSRIRKHHSNSEERILKMLLAQDDFVLRHTKQIERLRKDLICKTTKLSNIDGDFRNQINLQEAVYYVMVEEVEDEAQDALSKSLSQDRDTVIHFYFFQCVSLPVISSSLASNHFWVVIILSTFYWPVFWIMTFFVISTSFGTLITEYKDKKVDNSTRNNEPASTNKLE
ncbi:hypothetical protein WR25_04793 [Diploscapter pachys]|uniref:Uncharacterized protein n=1 Tax=Diploscapter pachys TaxID=2018661 RepID=A0A2A2LC45_9BILA|nr:hypothetical protein WR25_04793 [Diploscapter pachys]